MNFIIPKNICVFFSPKFEMWLKLQKKKLAPLKKVKLKFNMIHFNLLIIIVRNTCPCFQKRWIERTSFRKHCWNCFARIGVNDNLLSKKTRNFQFWALLQASTIWTFINLMPRWEKWIRWVSNVWREKLLLLTTCFEAKEALFYKQDDEIRHRSHAIRKFRNIQVRFPAAAFSILKVHNMS
jgi:hypothetical protein